MIREADVDGDGQINYAVRSIIPVSLSSTPPRMKLELIRFSPLSLRFEQQEFVKMMMA